MRTEGYKENDVVRVLRDITGTDPYGQGKIVSVPAGAVGTIIVGKVGSSHFDVEFMLQRSADKWENFALIIAAEDLESVPETATV